ncbi:kinase-like domain-containing protein [Fusarium redolens]|uniref:Kinase-like domain-containing protein n=1 Tax=Fusarium redolens TaxID=48865 RepID=A0A9P9R5J3_FUSRE|nr:kinase-like domain-containing protein [Fusarium redolens]KAH7267771.1 kinase-like domain-containing protein [Fusarium redolens]
MADISDSPPPTPTRFSYRFKNRSSPCEFADAYYPGGLHPVHLDDFFNDGQYKIIRKLGEGSFSTVWLAHDLKNSRYVALKILVSDKEKQSRELQILHYLAKVAPVESAHYITQLLDEFEHKGPNGTHKCLVFEAMGPSFCQMLLDPPGRSRTRHDKMQYPLQTAKHILRDVLKGLSFLHKNGISHGDFQPGNALFPLNQIDSYDEAALRQPPEKCKGRSKVLVVRKDGKEDKWAPQYLYAAEPLSNYTGLDATFKILDENLEVKLSDMGGAYFFNDPPKKPVVPIGLRAPELVLKGELHKTQDIWSFGCILFELITGRPLFYIFGPFKDETEPDDEHLLEVVDRLGPLPDELYSHWKTSSRYYTKDRKLYNWALGGVEEGEEPNMPEPSLQSTMEEAFDKESPEMTDEEAEEVKKLIRWILQYNPAKRPSAEEILCHPWFAKDSSEKAE